MLKILGILYDICRMGLTIFLKNKIKENGKKMQG